jgi:integrase
MSVHRLKDGRWIVQFPKGKSLENPLAVKRYFGRGEEGQRAAIEFNYSLGLATRNRQTSPLFVDLVNAYMQSRRQQLAATTWKTLVVRMEGTILPVLGKEMAHSLTPARLDRYAAIRTKTVKQVTIHREISDVRAILRWSVHRKLIASNPLEGFEMPKLDNARITPPSKAEFYAILQCAVPHLKRAMLISWFTGLRPGKEELLTLRWSACDFIAGTIDITSAQKNGLPSRMVPLHATILELLKRWYKEDQGIEHGYIIHYNGQPVDSLKTAWKNAKERAMIQRRLRMYDLRHSFTTTLLGKGADIKAVSQILGHSSLDMTLAVYYHVDSKTKRNAIDLLD